MKIKTIAALMKASQEDITEAMESVSIMEDLEAYQAWLADNEVTSVITTELKRYVSRSLGIHPSSACKKDVCLLKLYHEVHGSMKRLRAYDPVMQRTWDVGTLLHDTYQAWFRDMYPEQFKDEVGLKIPKLKVKSHTDGIFDFTQTSAILEMKSIKEGGKFGWEKVQLKPFEDNVRQAHFYMKASDTPFGVILYMNKNAGKLKEHVVRFEQDTWDDIVNRVIKPVITAKKPSDVDATTGFLCRYCDFSHSCSALKGETRAKRKSLPWRK
jgi:hypothetical protein